MGEGISILNPEPLDFQREESGFDVFYVSRVDEIRSLDGNLVIRGGGDPVLAVLKNQGPSIGLLGESGQGPGEFGMGIMAVEMHGDTIWALDGAKYLRLMRFVGGLYAGDVFLESIKTFAPVNSRNLIAANDEFVVVPAAGHTGNLASVYSVDGKVLDLGELNVSPSEELFARIPGINDTSWKYHDGRWYCLFDFFPAFLEYSADFTEERWVSIEDLALTGKHRDIVDWRPRENFNLPLPIFYDFEIKDDSLYVLSEGGRLTKISVTDGRTQATFMFKIGDSTKSFQSFAFWDDRIVLAHPAMLWGHDLWQVDTGSASL